VFDRAEIATSDMMATPAIAEAGIHFEDVKPSAELNGAYYSL
jgi:hypothetical protein